MPWAEQLAAWGVQGASAAPTWAAQADGWADQAGAPAAGLVLILGQSNAVGLAETPDLTDPSYADPFPAVSFRQRWAGSPVDPLTLSDFGPSSLQSYGSNRFGIELSAGRDLDAADPDRWAIAKLAVSGTNLAVHWDPAGAYPTATSPPNLYDQAVAYAEAAAAAEGKGLAFVAWLQGEADAGSGTWAPAYGANLTALIAALRADLGNVPFIFNRLTSASTATHEATLRAQQLVVAQTVPWVTMIDCDDLPPPDTLHFDADQMVTLGERFAAAYLAAAATTALTTALAASSSSVAPSAAYSYNVDLTASTAARDVTATITLPAGSAYTSSSGTGWTLAHAAGVVTATRATASAGALPTITVNLAAPATPDDYACTVSTVASNGPAASTDSVDVTVSAPAVTADATSGIYIPQTAAEWAALIASASLPAPITAPTSIYRCQDTGAPLVDSVGGFDLSLFGSGDVYRQAVAGWTSLAAGLTEGTTGAWRSLSASLPDISTTSCLLLAYVVMPTSTPAGNRFMVMLGGATQASVRVNTTTPRVSCISGGNAATGTTSPLSTIQPVLLKVDQTGNVQTAYTLGEKLTPTFAAVTGKACYLGSTGATGNYRYLYAARWDGAGAEVSDATAKLLLQALGWAITWT